MSPVQSLRNKVILITGSSTGIGKETALLSAKAGATVVVTFLDTPREGEAVTTACRRYGDAMLVPLDVTSHTSIETAHATILARYGRLDILVNNAGVLAWKGLLDQTPEEIDRQVLVNLCGLIQVTRRFLPTFLSQDSGVILNIASGAGKEAFAEMSVYCATKFGVRGFTQALSLELPATIRTYCVNPPMTATPMTGFKGEDPVRVAEVVVSAAAEILGKQSGDDVDIWEYL